MDVVLYVPSGLLRMTYDDAVSHIREDFGHIKIVKWSDNSCDYEDYQDANGNMVAQIQKPKSVE